MAEGGEEVNVSHEEVYTEETDNTETSTSHNNLIVVALGKSGAGKSTLINNLLRSDKAILLSPEQETQEIESKKGAINGSSLLTIDVPGFGPANKKWKKTLKDLTKYGKVNVILLCIPVGPSNKFDDGTPEIMRKISDRLGGRVWENCLVVFTFSNMALASISTGEQARAEKERDMYTTYLQTYTDKFREELHRLQVKDVSVKTVFQYKNSSHGMVRGDIITVPAGKDARDPMIPGSEEESWIDDILKLIVEKSALSSEYDLKRQYLCGSAKRGGVIGGIAGILGGGLAGGGAGAAIGTVGGGIGAAIGAAVGIGVGAVAGGVVGSSGGVAAPYAKEKLEEKKKEKSVQKERGNEEEWRQLEEETQEETMEERELEEETQEETMEERKLEEETQEETMEERKLEDEERQEETMEEEY